VTIVNVRVKRGKKGAPLKSIQRIGLKPSASPEGVYKRKKEESLQIFRYFSAGFEVELRKMQTKAKSQTKGDQWGGGFKKKFVARKGGN